MYRTLAGLAAAVAGALLLAGVSFSAASSQPADVRILNGTEPETLDPQQLTGSIGGRVVRAIFEGLTRPEARSLAPAPGVAARWDVSDDGLRYTFHLRESRWSDGVPIDASDFVWSWRHLLAPETAAKYAYLLHPLQGAKALNTFDGLARALDAALPELETALARARSAPLAAAEWRELTRRLPLHDSLRNSSDPRLRALLDATPGSVGAERLEAFVAALPEEAARLRAAAADARERFGTSLGVYAPDPRTLVVELEAPTPYFLELTSFYSTYAVPRHVTERFGQRWFLPEHIVSNGPFLLESWRVNDRIRLRKNPDYWGSAEVQADAIELYPVESVTTALNLFLTGEAHWMPQLYPSDLVSDLVGRPDFYTHPGFALYFYRFNTLRPPLNDARVRQALNLAVNRRVIVEEIGGLGQEPAAHVVPPGVPGYEPPPSAIRLDIERARELLAEAGYPGGAGFPVLGLLYNTLDVHKRIAEVVAHQLQEHLGIDVRPYNQEWQSYMATVRSGQYDLARAAWIGDYIDPNTFLDLWLTNGGNNQTGFSSPKYDALVRAAADVGRFAEAPGRLLEALGRSPQLQALLEQHGRATEGSERRRLLERLRMQLFTEAEAILVQQEFPVMPIYYYVNCGFKAPGLRGLYTEVEQPDGTLSSNLQPVHPLRDLWFDAAAPRRFSR